MSIKCGEIHLINICGCLSKKFPVKQYIDISSCDESVLDKIFEDRDIAGQYDFRMSKLSFLLEDMFDKLPYQFSKEKADKLKFFEDILHNAKTIPTSDGFLEYSKRLLKASVDGTSVISLFCTNPYDSLLEKRLKENMWFLWAVAHFKQPDFEEFAVDLRKRFLGEE